MPAFRETVPALSHALRPLVRPTASRNIKPIVRKPGRNFALDSPRANPTPWARVNKFLCSLSINYSSVEVAFLVTSLHEIWPRIEHPKSGGQFTRSSPPNFVRVGSLSSQ